MIAFLALAFGTLTAWVVSDFIASTINLLATERKCQALDRERELEQARQWLEDLYQNQGGRNQ